MSGIATAAALLLLTCFVILGEYMPAVVALGVAVIGASVVVGTFVHRDSVRLIVENRLLDICPVTIRVTDSGDESAQPIECVFSPFGLLIGSKVYKFGRDGIRLYSMEIGPSRISLDFGTEKRRCTAVFLHDPLSADEIEQLAERVKRETGITPSYAGSIPGTVER